jgi:hypothetical protein
MSTVMTGAKAKFTIDGKVIAYASNVSYNENIQYEAINVLDVLNVLEHAEVGYTVDMQCQSFRVPNQSVKQLGIMKSLPQLLTQGVMDSMVTDPDGNIILLMTGTKIQARQTTVDARGVMTETWSFVGLQAKDELDATG